jgi:hypothetical protein
MSNGEEHNYLKLDSDEKALVYLILCKSGVDVIVTTLVFGNWHQTISAMT